MPLTARVTDRDAVTAGHRDSMFDLMARHYDGVRREAFEADLARKDWVIQVFDARGSLCGFSTQALVRADGGAGPVAALFSGDTVVDRDHWGDPALSAAWGRLALRLMEDVGGPLHWFLISKGYKTYRFLPVFFREFWPRHDTPTPPEVRQLMGVLAGGLFGAGYDGAAGVVRATPGGDRLRAGVAPVTPQRLRDPHVRYFVERNPGHAGGDELCCLAPLTRDNFTPAAWRVIGARPECAP